MKYRACVLFYNPNSNAQDTIQRKPENSTQYLTFIVRMQESTLVANRVGHGLMSRCLVLSNRIALVAWWFLTHFTTVRLRLMMSAHHGNLDMSFKSKSKACAPHFMPVTLDVFTVHGKGNHASNIWGVI